MIKVRLSYSIVKLRLVISYLIKDDEYFLSILDESKEPFFYLFDRATATGNVKFYTFYYNKLPIACIGIEKKSKFITFFFIDKKYRTRNVLSEVFLFVHKKLGSYFYMGTTIKNKRFVDFCLNNRWDIYFEDNENIVFKCQQEE